MPQRHSALFEAALADPPPYPAGRFEGRSIVISAGGAKLFPCARVLFGMLRRVLGCRLPCFSLESGSDLGQIPPRIGSLLDRK